MLAAALLLRPVLGLAEPYAPYDGHNPFNCLNQDVGGGVDFQDPDADPFCVEFDKTRQNVTGFGIADFLLNEPARVAAAVEKCFYFQHDHWTGSVVQDGEPELWHWDGSYWFDRARGSGGVHVANFRIGGEPADFAPYAPPEFRPYLAPGGGGGALVEGAVDADPSCAQKVDSPLERRFVYYHRIAAGRISRTRIAPVLLGTPRRATLWRLGPAHRRAAHTDRWDLKGGGELRIGWRGPALDRRVAALLTTGPRHHRDGVSVGDAAGPARRALDASPSLGGAAPIRGYRVLEAPRRGPGRLFLGLRSRRVAWIAIVRARAIPKDAGVRRVLGRLLARAPQDGRG